MLVGFCGTGVLIVSFSPNFALPTEQGILQHNICHQDGFGISLSYLREAPSSSLIIEV